jgi:hypothetical protein
MEARIATRFDAERIEIPGCAQCRVIYRATHRIALSRDARRSQQNATGGDMILEQNPTRAIKKTRR